MDGGSYDDGIGRTSFFDQAPGLLALFEGPDLRLAELNRAGRDLLGEDAVAALRSGAVTGPVAELLALVREVGRTGADRTGQWGSDGRGRLSIALAPWHGPDGTPRGVVAQALPSRGAETAAPPAPAATVPSPAAAPGATDQTLVALQDALLPGGVPIPRGVRVAARYLLADEGVVAGGDWFDAVTLEDGRLVLAVGDVVGHGVRASVAMGELRALFEERARLDGDIEAALELLDSRARRVPPARAATVCAAVLDPRTGELVYCTAGHPPPMVVNPAGETTFLPASGAGPLASGLPFELAEHQLEEGDVLVMYSDGIVERPGRTVAQCTVDLSEVVREAVLAGPDLERIEERLPERICRESIERLAGSTGVADDITVLAAELVEPMPDLELSYPAMPDTPRVVRVELAEWLDELQVGPLDEVALQHAVGEVVTNACEHAYSAATRRSEAVVEVTAHLDDEGVVEVTVRDTGSWRAPGAPGTRGRGLAMARGFTDEFELHHGEEGTTARLRLRPTRSVGMLTASGADASSRAPLTIEERPGLLLLGGTVDHRGTDELRRRIAHASYGGTSDLVIDMSAVTLLASAGVQVLYEAMAPANGFGLGVVHLVAPLGSPAQHVLEMVRLPYATS
ncbi:SpoIIE family protein phosphatase [Nocardioides sp. zg-579]|uniref:SpoIIE family protein phosphatase n=3 Tax=Nocardioides marmotae TaxID=2663857 RepID=A0A6I3JGL8_9ACTN|nr:SpoIIE family protein phosphatase [Gordonia jinghuaiqii]MTB97210.1 SpoIIE family protein phosphatase [Nocardioides marmotae]